MKHASFTDEEKKRQVMELTSLFLHKHYGENSTELLLAHLDDVFSWVGAAEHEYSADPDVVASTLRSFAGKVPHCNISDEHYDVIQPMPDIFICSGTLWVSTSPASETYLRVHQRISTVFRWSEKGPRCCHLHLSNPYDEMDEGDVGFPEKMSLESRRYFQEQIALQKKQIEEQHAFIVHMYVGRPLHRPAQQKQIQSGMRKPARQGLRKARHCLLRSQRSEENQRSARTSGRRRAHPAHGRTSAVPLRQESLPHRRRRVRRHRHRIRQGHLSRPGAGHGPGHAQRRHLRGPRRFLALGTRQHRRTATTRPTETCIWPSANSTPARKTIAGSAEPNALRSEDGRLRGGGHPRLPPEHVAPESASAPDVAGRARSHEPMPYVAGLRSRRGNAVPSSVRRRSRP